MWIGPDFGGAKLALIRADEILVYRRDDKPDIPFPSAWDMPGGGREGDESPLDCALRETEEEFGLRLPAERIGWQRLYPSTRPGKPGGYFMAGAITLEEIRAIRFGVEGQYWRMMAIDTFLAESNAVPYLQTRLADYLRETGSG